MLKEFWKEFQKKISRVILQRITEQFSNENPREIHS